MKLQTRKRRNGGVAWFTVWRENGRRRYHTFDVPDAETCRREFNSTPEEIAREMFYAWKAERARSALGRATRPDLTLADALDAHRIAKQPDVSPGHARNLANYADTLADALGPDTPVAAIDDHAIADLKLALTQRFSPPTANAHLRFLVAAVQRAVTSGQLVRLPFGPVQMITDRRPEDWRYLDQDEIDRLLNAARPRPAFYDMILFLAYTGARLSECLDLRWRDIDLPQATVALTTSKRASRGRRALTRHIPLHPALLDNLRQRADSALPTPFSHVPANNLQRDFQVLVRRAEIAGHVRIHDLRHTFASRLAISGVALATIRDLLGHASITTTERYAHLCPDLRVAAVANLPAPHPPQNCEPTAPHPNKIA